MNYNMDSSDNFNPRNTSNYNNISSLATGSAFTSATALLQKASEMGAKIRDNTIAPILLMKGFTPYNPPIILLIPNSMNIINNSSNSVEEDGGRSNIIFQELLAVVYMLGILNYPSIEKIMGMSREDPNNNVTRQNGIFHSSQNQQLIF